MPQRRFTASFRIYGTKVSPETITAKLGIEPTDIQRKGEKKAIGGKRRENMWGLQSSHDPYDSPENNILSLCNLLRPKRAELISLSHKCTNLFWCAYFTYGPETTITLAPDVMSEILSYQASISISVYLCSEPEASEE